MVYCGFAKAAIINYLKNTLTWVTLKQHLNPFLINSMETSILELANNVEPLWSHPLLQNNV
jgi:hypothetical protein